MNVTKILILLLLLGSGAILWANPIGLSIPYETCTVGDFINIPIYADSSLSGENVYAFQLQVNFNGNMLRIEDVISTETVSAGFGQPIYNTSTSGRVTVAAAGAEPLEGSGVLLYLRFEALQSGTTGINFGSTAYNYLNEGQPELLLSNGSLAVQSLPTISISPNGWTLLHGEQLQFSVNGGSEPYQWNVTNEAVATIDSSGLLTAVGGGFTKVVVRDAQGAVDETNNEIEVRDVHLQIQDFSAVQGDVVDIPIYIHDFSSTGLLAGAFTVQFWSHQFSVLQLVTEGSLLVNHPMTTINHSVPGETTVAFAGETPIAGDGILCFIRMVVSTTHYGNSSFDFTAASFNEGIPAITDDGYVHINALSPLRLTPTSGELLAGETVQFSAEGGMPPYSWSITDSTVATIDHTGLFVSQRSGTVRVTVKDSLGATTSSQDIQIYGTQVSVANTNGFIGEICDVPVSIGALPEGQPVYSLLATLTFPLGKLEALGVVTDSTLTQGWAFSYHAMGNQIVIAGAGESCIEQSGILLKAPFRLTAELTVGERADIHLTQMELNEGLPMVRTTDGSITGEAGASETLNIVSGWNLIAAPFGMPTMDINTHFPHAQVMWKYTAGAGWSVPDSLELGYGYWLKNTETENIVLYGQPVAEFTLTLQPGWNLVSTPIDFVLDDPRISVIWQYNSSGWQEPEMLVRGAGYWVKANEAMQLELGN